MELPSYLCIKLILIESGIPQTGSTIAIAFENLLLLLFSWPFSWFVQIPFKKYFFRFYFMHLYRIILKKLRKYTPIFVTSSRQEVLDVNSNKTRLTRKIHWQCMTTRLVKQSQKISDASTKIMYWAKKEQCPLFSWK